jgi:hypothetical protein
MNNAKIYNGAYSGATAGMLNSRVNLANYDQLIDACSTFADAVDTAIPPSSGMSDASGELMNQLCQAALINRYSIPIAASVVTQVVAAFNALYLSLSSDSGNVMPLYMVRNVSTQALTDLSTYAVDDNDGVANVEGDVVLLAGPATTLAAMRLRGPFVVGPVVDAIATLTRPSWFTGVQVKGTHNTYVQEGVRFNGTTWNSNGPSTVFTVGTDPIFFFPNVVGQRIQLVNGTAITKLPLASSASGVSVTRTVPNFDGETFTIDYEAVLTGGWGNDGYGYDTDVRIDTTTVGGIRNAGDQSTVSIVGTNTAFVPWAS